MSNKAEGSLRKILDLCDKPEPLSRTEIREIAMEGLSIAAEKLEGAGHAATDKPLMSAEEFNQKLRSREMSYDEFEQELSRSGLVLVTKTEPRKLIKKFRIVPGSKWFDYNTSTYEYNNYSSIRWCKAADYIEASNPYTFLRHQI